MDALAWGLAPRRAGPAKVVIGSSGELEAGGRVWFRVRRDGKGDRLSRYPTVAEVRTAGRARERVDAVTGMYRTMGWTVVAPPQLLAVPEPPVGGADVYSGLPLQTWAEAVAEIVAERGA